MPDRSDASSDAIAKELRVLQEAQQKGPLGRLGVYVRLSGPGWLQSAITLGGGSLAGSLYLGVLGGFSLLWLQPAAMILGIIMLSAIGYVTLSTGERPFRAINEHVNPVLGWSWALATLAANIVWCMPQFALATAVLQQNLLPNQVGSASPLGDVGGKLAITAVILLVTIPVTWSYGSGHWGVKLYEIVLKMVVAAIVLCFIAVAVALHLAGQLDWGAVAQGFWINPWRIFSPGPEFETHLSGLDTAAREFWTSRIVQDQLNTVATAAATAVGINMTFLYPYSLLRKGWRKEFRGLAIFDLATGMFIPFVLATSCVVIAAASQFHGRAVPGLSEPAEDAAGVAIEPTAKEAAEYKTMLTSRLAALAGPEQGAALSREGAALSAAIEALPLAERQLAAMLVHRDADKLSQALTPLTGPAIGNRIFGLGVVGMALSTITILMLISGFVLCEMLDIEPSGWPFRWCCLAASVGALGPFFWSKASFALALPTSVFGLILLPIAYLTFFLLMNQRQLLGDDLPRGRARAAWNALMFTAASIATAASVYMVWNQAGRAGLGAMGALLGLALIVQIVRGLKQPGRSI